MSQVFNPYCRFCVIQFHTTSPDADECPQCSSVADEEREQARAEGYKQGLHDVGFALGFEDAKDAQELFRHVRWLEETARKQGREELLNALVLGYWAPSWDALSPKQHEALDVGVKDLVENARKQGQEDERKACLEIVEGWGHREHWLALGLARAIRARGEKKENNEET